MHGGRLRPQRQRLVDATVNNAALLIIALARDQRLGRPFLIGGMKPAQTVGVRQLCLDLLVPDSAVDALLRAVAEIACRICNGAMCVVEGAGTSAGVGGLGFGSHEHAADAAQPSPSAASGVQLLVASDPSERTDLTLTLSLLRAPYVGETGLLRLLAAVAGSRLCASPRQSDGSRPRTFEDSGSTR